jgi:hypothetical protein
MEGPQLFPWRIGWNCENRVKKPLFVSIALIVFLTRYCAADEKSQATNAPALIELRDQYDAPQKIAFPTTNAFILVIADRKSSGDVAGWIDALRPVCERRAQIAGLANVAGVPLFLQPKIRKMFQQTQTYPVMLDWSGKLCRQLGEKAGAATLLVIDRGGAIRARLEGKCSETGVAEALKALNAIEPPGHSLK